MTNSPPESLAWQNYQKKRKRTIVLLISVVLILAIVIAVLAGMSMTDSATATGKTEKRTIQINQSGKTPAMVTEKIAPESLHVFRLNDCRAFPKGEKQLQIFMTLDLHYQNTAFDAEIRERSNDLRVLTAKVTASRTLHDMKIDLLRPDLITAFNKLLKTGSIRDIRFSDFRIERSVH